MNSKAINPDQDTAIRNLIVEVVKQAKRDAQTGSPAKRQDAIDWLLSDGQAWIDAIADIHPDHVRRWVQIRQPVSNATARCKNRTERPRTNATA
jgi:hypothetical protein